MPTLRVWFTLICMVEYIVVALLAELTAWLIKKWLGITVAAPLFVWAVLFSVIFGFVITNFTLKVFFDPVAKLEKAMRTVAGGNFKVTAETDSRINEVRSLYSSFNMMVKELSATETLQMDFISSVSHEFKTPINAIEGYAGGAGCLYREDTLQYPPPLHAHREHPAPVQDKRTEHPPPARQLPA